MPPPNGRAVVDADSCHRPGHFWRAGPGYSRRAARRLSPPSIKKRLGRGGVSCNVAAAGTQISVRQPSSRPPDSSPLRGEHRDARGPTSGTKAPAERPRVAPPDATTPPALHRPADVETRRPVSALGTFELPTGTGESLVVQINAAGLARLLAGTPKSRGSRNPITRR